MTTPFYIIGVRFNPQLGSYLSKVIVAKATYNKASITAKFEEYNSTTALKFNLNHDNSGKHYTKSSSNCVYGSYFYYGFHSKDDAINELKTWVDTPGLSGDRAKNGIMQLKAT